MVFLLQTNSLRTIVDYCIPRNGLHVMYFSDGNRLINSLRFRSGLEKFSVNVHGYNQLMAAYRVYMRLTDETYCVHVEASRTNLLSHGLAFVWISEFSYTLTLFSPSLLSVSLFPFLNSHDTTAFHRMFASQYWQRNSRTRLQNSSAKYLALRAAHSMETRCGFAGRCVLARITHRGSRPSLFGLRECGANKSRANRAVSGIATIPISTLDGKYWSLIPRHVGVLRVSKRTCAFN